MKFIVDAQLPRRLVREIIGLGGDAIHTLDLPRANLTTDSEIIALAMQMQAIVVTKDHDFVDSFLLNGEPPKLLFVTTGNIPNNDLLALIRANWTQLVALLAQDDFVEISRTAITVHA